MASVKIRCATILPPVGVKLKPWSLERLRAIFTRTPPLGRFRISVKKAMIRPFGCTSIRLLIV
jgi:hypothetical protein